MKARDNPFSADRIDIIHYKPVDICFDELLMRLEEMKYRAAIIGPEGSGKTTLLEDLRTAIENSGLPTKNIFVNSTNLLTFPRMRELIANLTDKEIILLDGADQLNRLRWLLLKQDTLKKSAGLIITTHQRQLLPVLIKCSTTQLLFREIVAELVPKNVRINPYFLNEIYNHNSGNIRNCLRQLYDIYASDAIISNCYS